MHGSQTKINNVSHVHECYSFNLILDFALKLNDPKIPLILKSGILCTCVNFELILSLTLRLEC